MLIDLPIQRKICTEYYKLRSYRPNDYEQIKRLFISNITDELNYDLLGIDLFLEHSSEYCFLIENKNTQQISGVLLGALNAIKLNNIYMHKCLAKLCDKYPSNADYQAIINYQVSFSFILAIQNIS